MATNELSLASLAKRLDPKGNLAEIAEVLEEDNEILEDLIFEEANNITHHVSTARKLLPSGKWTKIGGFVTPEKSETRQITEQIGYLKSYSNVPVDMVRLNTNQAKFRKDEDKGFLQGLTQTMAEAFIYGESAEADSFPGLTERYNTTSLSNVHSGGGDGNDNKTSIWIVQHDMNLFHAVYPRGSKVGLDVKDLGEQTEQNSDGDLRQVYRTKFEWEMGIVVRDDRAVQRIANIIVTDTAASYSSFDDLIIKALNLMPKRGKGAAIYANRDMMTMFDILSKDKSNVAYNSAEVFGKTVTTFRGIPIRLVEAITSAEDLAS
jgi:hypothetical protein